MLKACVIHFTIMQFNKKKTVGFNPTITRNYYLLSHFKCYKQFTIT